MNIDIGKMISNVSQIKLKGGIFAKASTVIIVVSVCLFGIAALTRNIWVSCVAIGFIFILSFVILMRLLSFANKNPQAAILEGAEFLVHEHIQMAAKGIPNISDSLSLLTEGNPLVKNLTIDEINKPDENELKGKEDSK